MPTGLVRRRSKEGYDWWVVVAVPLAGASFLQTPLASPFPLTRADHGNITCSVEQKVLDCPNGPELDTDTQVHWVGKKRMAKKMNTMSCRWIEQGIVDRLRGEKRHQLLCFEYAAKGDPLDMTASVKTVQAVPVRLD